MASGPAGIPLPGVDGDHAEIAATVVHWALKFCSLSETFPLFVRWLSLQSEDAPAEVADLRPDVLEALATIVAHGQAERYKAVTRG